MIQLPKQQNFPQLTSFFSTKTFQSKWWHFCDPPQYRICSYSYRSLCHYSESNQIMFSFEYFLLENTFEYEWNWFERFTRRKKYFPSSIHTLKNISTYT